MTISADLVAAVGSVVVVVVGATIWITTQLGSIRERLVRIETKLGIDDDSQAGGGAHAYSVR